MEVNQFRIGNMIRALRAIQEDEGDLLVFVSSDEIGSEIKPVGIVGDRCTEFKGESITSGPAAGENLLTIYPCGEVTKKFRKPSDLSEQLRAIANANDDTSFQVPDDSFEIKPGEYKLSDILSFIADMLEE